MSGAPDTMPVGTMSGTPQVLLVNVTGTFPRSGEVKFPTLRFSGSGMDVAGTSIFRRPTATSGFCGVCCNGFGQEVCVAPQAITGAFDLNDDSVMK